MPYLKSGERRTGTCRHCGKAIRFSIRRGKHVWRHGDAGGPIHCAPVPPKAAPEVDRPTRT